MAAARWLLAVLYIAAGLLHLYAPGTFLLITPDWVPFPRAVILGTGLCEIAGALAVLTHRLRRAAGMGLVLFWSLAGAAPSLAQLDPDQPALLQPEKPAEAGEPIRLQPPKDADAEKPIRLQPPKAAKAAPPAPLPPALGREWRLPFLAVLALAVLLSWLPVARSVTGRRPG